MSMRHLQQESHLLKDDETAWWEEENQGIKVIVEHPDASPASIIKIPWRAIRAALARKDRP